LVKRKRKHSKRSAAASAPPPPADSFSNASPPAGEDGQIQSSGLSLHELFAQQARTMLDRTDLDDEQKQSILVAMSCPCCGAGGLSFTAKIKRRS
jgi:hypothetical protein